MTPGLYRTRSDHFARVLCNDAPGNFPVVGYWIRGPGDIVPEKWTAEGKYVGWIEINRFDIISPWEEAT